MSKLSEKVEQLSSSQRLLLALNQAVAKLEASERSKTEPIAIIGMSCRFPGGANSPEAYWELLRDGVDAIIDVPPERWDIEQYYDPDPNVPGKIYIRCGGFLRQIDEFDPQFFGISPREALSMDPQQRLLLEVSWEALERAGQIRDRLIDSSTGVFIGVSNCDYGRLLISSGDLTQMDTYYTTGNTLNAAAGRLSYTLGLKGPSMAVDSACSSSLVTVHLACQSLRNGDCNQALAGGVNLILSPETTVGLSRAQILSPDGRCKAFDASANGMIRGEGCGIIVLKRLSDAIADRDQILAVIRGSAVNQDGPSSGLTVPNGVAQEALIRQALSRAKIAATDVSYIEAHGTGTSLGDPIEVRALGNVLCQGRSPDQPLTIGTVKSNIGHLESASGIAGLIKVVLALQHQQIPGNLHFQTPSPYIDWAKIPVKVPTQLTPWEVAGKTRIAGVSSFGLSGTNAHVILEEAPQQTVTPAAVERSLHLLTLSAKSPEVLEKFIHLYQSHLNTQPEQKLADICFTANTGRGHFPYRLSVVAASTTEASEQLAAGNIYRGELTQTTPPQIAYLMTGQGSQYVGMAKELYHSQPTFKQALDKCDQILSQYLDTSILDIIYAKTETSDKLEQTAYTQPALFAIEYALCQLWQSWGIAPSTVMGHSVGEYVAACIAGIFSLEDGLKLIAARGRLMQALPHNGAMAAVMADAGLVKQLISPEIAIAAINAPQNTVISGTKTAVNELCGKLHNQGIKTTALAVSHAFHSPLMQPMLAEFAHIAQQISYHPPQINIISNITGELVRDEMTTAEYWCRHILQPVQFAAGVRTLQQLNCQIWLEVGPKPVLLGMARQCLDNTQLDKVAWLPSLRPGQSDWQQILASLAQMYVAGVTVNWSGFDQDYERRRLLLPTYPFQRQRFWADVPKNSDSQKNEQAIANFLSPNKITKLTQQLVISGKLSQEERQLAPKLIELLVQQYQQQLNSEHLNDWLYEVSWLVQARKSQPRNQQPGMWLILADQKGIGQAIAQSLAQQNHQYCLCYASETSKQLDPHTWNINPSSPDNWQNLLQELAANSELPFQGIIHLWSLDTADSSNLSLTALAAAQVLICSSVLHLLQAYQVNNLANAPRLWLVTQGATPVSSSITGVGQASLWGLGRVIALEYPELWGGLIDLAPAATAEEIQMLLTEIQAPEAEDQLAIHNDQRYVARLRHSLPDAPLSNVSLTADATYLITGGLGGLGLEVAQWMGQQGVRHLVLVGRRSASDQARAMIEALEKSGVKVLVAQADVSQYEDMSQLLEEVKILMPPLKGIIHAAGVLHDGLLMHQTWERFTQVMSPKIAGTWNLHTLTQNTPLDFFVCFSSAAALLGSPGQGNYAAANAFMDALVHYRRSLGLPGTSINWGAWADVGMVANLQNQHQTRLAAKGMSPLQIAQGLQVLGQLLGQSKSQVGVLPINWSDFQQQLGLGQKFPLLAELIAVDDVQQSASKSTDGEFLQKLQSASPNNALEMLTAYIQAEIAKVLGLQRSQLPQRKQNFFDMGMDSLTAVELKNRLERSLQISLSSTLLFNYPNIDALVQYLAQEVLTIALPAASTNEDMSSTTASLEEIQELSESEIMALIAEEFEAHQ
ncbi:type I polyketide synthase [Nostoc sp. UHCC 0702]|nr:type I polyketide synthase [Nostoc sp. UHCC 0702]